MRKPRILLDTYYLHVAQTGIKTYMLSLCEEILRQSQADCQYVLSPDFRKVQDSRFFKGKTSRWKNLLFQILYFWRKHLVTPLLSYYHRADIVFCPDIMVPIWGRGIPVSVLHDTFFWDNPAHYQPQWLKFYLFFLEKGLRKNGQIITITEFSRQRISQLPGIGQIPIHVVYPASGQLAKPESEHAGAKIDFPYMLHVGVMEKRKNLGLLIRALQRLRLLPGYGDWKLVLVGQRGPRQTLDDFDQLQDLVKKLKLEENVIFTGYIPADELAAYFRHAEAYVFPSLNEGFGLPVLEAFSYGLPVIISNQGALKEVAGDAALLMEDPSPEALVRTIVKLHGNPALADELAEKGRKRLAEFSTEKFFLSLDQTFKKIIHG